MRFYLFLKVLINALIVIGFSFSLAFAAEESESIDALLAQTIQYLKKSPEKATLTLAKLQKFEHGFSDAQRETYHHQLITSLGFRGEYKEQIALIKSIYDQTKNQELRASFLYNLSDAYTNIGEYEQALVAMNEGILLLPKLINLNAKVDTLQAAVSLLSSLHAYDEAMQYVDRMDALEENGSVGVSKCIAIADRVEIGFLRGDRQLAKALYPKAVHLCDMQGSNIISFLLQALAAIDMIDSGDHIDGLNAGLMILLKFPALNMTSPYVTQLEEAISRAYLKINNFPLAEHYAMQAYQRAKNGNMAQLMEKSSETMAIIKRAQGQLKSSLEYYDINLVLKKKVLDDQLHKSLAYQRVKFDVQDKANQLALAEQKNKTLIVEKALQQGRNQNLLLFITLGLILLTVLGAWLAKTWQQKNQFRTSSQTDGLTQVSNRAHFMACAMHAFKDARIEVSVVLFDMDFFKKINDAFGHAAGDWVLKTVCDVVKIQLRKSDVLGRLGGEEFAMCLLGMTPEDVLVLAERCRVAIAAVDTTPSGFIFDITASFGIATRPAHALSTFEEVLAAADKALYLSKNEGRNRVSVYR